MVVINGIFYGISMDIDEKLMGSIQQLSHQFTNYMVNVQSHMECGPPAHEIAKLANITPISRWLQWCLRHPKSWGVYKPSNWGGFTWHISERKLPQPVPASHSGAIQLTIDPTARQVLGCCDSWAGNDLGGSSQVRGNPYVDRRWQDLCNGIHQHIGAAEQTYMWLSRNQTRNRWKCAVRAQGKLDVACMLCPPVK